MRSAVIWLVNGNDLPDHCLPSFLAYLSQEEVRRYQRFVRPVRQREYLVGRVLLRFAVAGLTAIAPDEVGVVERSNNAPLLVLPGTTACHPWFSLSHSRGWVACAISADTPLGLDIEALDGSRDLDGLGLAAFSAAENSWLSSHAGAARIAAFYDLWSGKEALYKLMSNTDNSSAMPELVAGGVKLASGPDWHVRKLPHPEFAISLCSLDPLASIGLTSLAGETPAAWSAAMRSSA
ncbi:4'-phosphopantetheinyl transferase superfamily protein [Paraherbaspirillum soli]|uniref:4'-phosphopantetheinyl transferase superfamily protein n=1 Tax=Paraherbaspirillum soli TaxID=631222 RepID=A0ABW0M9D1_9BURK